MNDYAQLLPIARAAMSTAREIVLSRGSFSVAAKGDRDMVTDVDLAVEDAVRGLLGKETPEIPVVGEERGGRAAGGLWWTLDPVDGTANFARGIPLCAVSLALVDGSRSVLAAISAPFLDVEYSAVDGHGAWAGEQRLRCSEVTDIADAVISLGDFALEEHESDRNRVRLGLLRDLGARAQRVRMIGTSAIDLAWVAHGKLDGTINLSNHPWDTMAGVLLVREAGGVVLDEDGTGHSADSAVTIALSPGVRDEIMATLRRNS
ncbi:inositol monophosphatase family protein [Amycolatopsis sp. NPDC059027]|uniref:inositol monophosphatase family protein n=1 Tax=Amycolatopsis sp. NPDC059027 TaxID=3346709 RepID=UPI00366B3C85